MSPSPGLPEPARVAGRPRLSRGQPLKSRGVGGGMDTASAQTSSPESSRRSIVDGGAPTLLCTPPIWKSSPLCAEPWFSRWRCCSPPVRRRPHPVRPGPDGTPDTQPFPDKPRVEAKKDAAADAALAQAIETAARAPDKKQAAEALLTVRKTYPATTASQEALYRAGVLYFEAEDYANARKIFNELLFENPLYSAGRGRQAQAGPLRAGGGRLPGCVPDALQPRRAGRGRREASGCSRTPAGPPRARACMARRWRSPCSRPGDAKTPQEQAAAVAAGGAAGGGPRGLRGCGQAGAGAVSAPPGLARAHLQAGAHLLPPARLDAAGGDAEPLPARGAQPPLRRAGAASCWLAPPAAWTCSPGRWACCCR